jgi:hypothetical protein
MKVTYSMLAITALWAGTAAAAPLTRPDVAGTAKWVLHLDAEKLRPTKVGEAIARQIDAKMVKPTADLKFFLGLDFDWRRITALTAYGTSFKAQAGDKGVLLVYSDMDVETALETTVAKLASAGQADSGPVRRLEAAPNALYRINDELYVACRVGRPAILSKSRRLIDEARATLAGSTPSLQESQALAGFAVPESPMFALATVEGFNEQVPIPPLSKTLQNAEALRLVLGEKGEELRLNLALEAKSAETATQIQQVLQGLVALAALNEVQNQDLQILAQSLKVSTKGKLVSAELRYPVAKALEKIAEKARKEGNP